MAYMIEETKGKFPVWLAPLQVKVLPVSEKTMDYAKQVNQALEDANIRTQLDERSEKIGYKIREARQIDRAPYMLILGAKEAEEGTISVRNRDTDETTVMNLNDFIAKVRNEIATRAR